MGLRLQYRETDDKYRFWNTVIDEWVTDWIDREGALRFLYQRDYLEFQTRIIERYFTFPHNLLRKDDGRVARNLEGWQRYEEWHDELSGKTEGQYMEFIDETFSRIAVEIGAGGVAERSKAQDGN